jgi:hypothetical protein
MVHGWFNVDRHARPWWVAPFRAGPCGTSRVILRIHRFGKGFATDESTEPYQLIAEKKRNEHKN